MQNIIIWDNDGTIMGAKDPNDTSNAAKIILPNVEKTMRQENTFNIVCSGMKTFESELQNFDPVKIIEKFKQLMLKLPVQFATFSPAIGGVECWVVIKKNDTEFEIRKAHEDNRYKHLIGKFKKPDIGMLIIIKDLVEEYDLKLQSDNSVFIGDAEQDRLAAQTFKIPFMHATHIHTNQSLLLFVTQDDVKERIAAWKAFFTDNHNWHKEIQNCIPKSSGCGLIYELDNVFNRHDESYAIVDMRHISCAQPHYHPNDCVEIYFVLQGTGLVIVGCKEYSVGIGDYVIIPPNTAHYTIPDNEFVIAVINIPAYRPEHYIPLTTSNPEVIFDFDQFQKLPHDIKIIEIKNTDLVSQKIDQARSIFISYFSDLYKNIPSQTLGINNIQGYLNDIFEKTKQSLEQNEINASLAYINNKAVGFATFGVLEDAKTVLLRTLPIDLEYKNKETEIRKDFISHIHTKFPETTNIIIMARKANQAYISFCEKEGFKIDDTIFDRSDYAKKTYDKNWYTAYSLTLHCL